MKKSLSDSNFDLLIIVYKTSSNKAGFHQSTTNHPVPMAGKPPSLLRHLNREGPVTLTRSSAVFTLPPPTYAYALHRCFLCSRGQKIRDSNRGETESIHDMPNSCAFGAFVAVFLPYSKCRKPVLLGLYCVSEDDRHQETISISAVRRGNFVCWIWLMLSGREEPSGETKLGQDDHLRDTGARSKPVRRVELADPAH